MAAAGGRGRVRRLGGIAVWRVGGRTINEGLLEGAKPCALWSRGRKEREERR